MARREDGALVKFLARKVRERREAELMTQEQLAEKAGIRVQTLSRIENGKTQASIAVVKQLARALGCTAGALLEEQDLASKMSSQPTLSGRERELLAVWRGLTPRSQLAAIELLVELGVMSGSDS